MITTEQFEKICQTIESTCKSIPAICKQFKVSTTHFYALMNSSNDNIKRYARAKELQVEPMLNEIRELQDDCMKDIRNMDDPRKCNAIQSAYREKIRHIEWIISKLLPKRYGDKIEVDNTHKFPTGISINFTRGDRSPKKSDDN